MTKKIFRSIFSVVGIVLIASIVLVMFFLYDYFGDIQERQLKDELKTISSFVEKEGTSYFTNYTSDRYRITLIESDGTVLYDTEADASTLENHSDRKEVQQALATGEGSSVRFSDTVLERTMYQAVKLPDGSILRISTSSAAVATLLLGCLPIILAIIVAALILCAVLAHSLSKKIVEPLNRINLEHPLDNDTYEEISPLLQRINKQHKQIKAQMRELQMRTAEFTKITENMQEGLVLLDSKGNVLSINKTACELFGVDEECLHNNFLTVDRSHEMSQAISKAMENGHSENREERDGMIWQFDISRIDSADETVGTVILGFDITEQENAEQIRREFSANVSHELKTPLAGIIGSAELLQSGMVQKEDESRFVGHIHDEAQRLLTLVGDIIRLSQLDEKVELIREEVDLNSLVNTVSEDLSSTAAKRHISITVSESATEDFKINAVYSLVYEAVYNLVDNAIKYNKPSGKVVITLSKESDYAVVDIADNGIGIPLEHQNKIFERFYRVDKSHSKASGGTGLGLSIVKHAVQYHDGKLAIESEPGKGTSIKIKLPIKNNNQVSLN